MKHLIIPIFLFFVAGTLGCAKSAKEPAQSAPATNSVTTQAPSGSQQLAQDPTVPVSNPFGAPPAKTQAAQIVTAEGMNPPHGQPNHRCDIPVGAPLNSPPGTRPTQPTTLQPNVTLQSVPTTTAVTAPGMNPPHGQPGHRCDVKVGAPLSSAPAATK
ncbi:MAG: hypothetical protein WBP29_07300 [Candidatus Zixiibacteriota bacterium]